MKRLTKKDFNICNVCDRGPLGMNWSCDGFPACGEKAAYERLAAYEDTGLEPEGIEQLKGEAFGLRMDKQVLEHVKRALAMMWFAYVNSDKETPHDYETEALEAAERILGPWTECMPKYLRRGQKED